MNPVREPPIKTQPAAEVIVAPAVETLHQAYSALQGVNQYLRELMFQVASAAMGAIIVADGWFIGRSLAPDFRTRAAISVGFILVTFVAIYSVTAHYREYLASSAMIVRVERALGFYDTGRFIAQDTLYSPESKEWGTGRFSSHILQTYVTGILLIAGVSLALVWFL